MPKRTKHFVRVFVESPHITSRAAAILLRRDLMDQDESKGWRRRIRWRDGVVRKVIDAGIPLMCEFCGRQNLIPFPKKGSNNQTLTLDHFMPYSRTKNDNLDNLVLACIPCNSRKSDRYPTDEEKHKIRTIEFLLNNAGQSAQIC